MQRTTYRAVPKYAMNSAIRASESLVRELAGDEGTVYHGGRPERTGDVYKRLWTGENGRTVTALAHPWAAAP